MKNKEPMWIALEIPLSDGFINVRIGLNQPTGNIVEFCSDADIEHIKEINMDTFIKTKGGGEDYDAFLGGNQHLGYILMNITEGLKDENFDENYRLIKNPKTEKH